MPRQTRPRVLTRCVANHHAQLGQRIIEFSDAATDAGGLILFSRRIDARGRAFLQVTIYRQNNTRVYTEKGGTR